jgi:hypothetical protein
MSKLERKIARQMVAFKWPNQKQTNGEMNEEASYAQNSPYFKNIMRLIASVVQDAKIDELERLLLIYGSKDAAMPVKERLAFLKPPEGSRLTSKGETDNV